MAAAFIPPIGGAMLRRMSRLGALVALLLAALLCAAPAAAQQVQRIAAIVNDEVISGFDLESRVELVIRSTRQRDDPETRRRLRREVLRALVDEKLQLQEAARNNVKVGDDEIQRAFAAIARQNNVPEERFDDFLRAAGVPKSALEQQVRAEIAWGKLLRRRLRAAAVVSEEEIDEAMERLRQNADQPESQISEIFLPVDSPELEAETQRVAARIAEEIRAGAPFGAMARQFSRGTTAATGGAVGWVRAGQLAPELAQVVEQLQPGEVSDPVRAPGGYYVIQLHDRRTAAGASETSLRLKRVQLPDSVDLGEAARVAAEFQGCEQADAAAQRLGAPTAGDVADVRLNELPPRLRGVLAELPIGKFSEPVRDEVGAMLLMVCSRETVAGKLPSREEISEGLMRQRMAMLAQRYLRDLRRSAVVELR